MSDLPALCFTCSQFSSAKWRGTSKGPGEIRQPHLLLKQIFKTNMTNQGQQDLAPSIHSFIHSFYWINIYEAPTMWLAYDEDTAVNK